MSYQLIRGDALALPLADESVDACVTSPPYFALRSYTDGGEHYDGQIGSEATPQAFLEALWVWTAECRRVLKPSGSLWVNLGDKYSGAPAGNPGAMQTQRNGLDERRAGVVDPRGFVRNKSLMLLPQRYAIGCIDQLGLICRAEVIWSKPNGLPESVTDRVRRSHEQWFHFVKEPRYFSAVDEVREVYAAPTATRTFGNVDPSRGDHGKPAARMDAADVMNPLGKLPSSVWTIPTEPLRVPDHLGVDHFAAFPSEWPRRIILGWSPSGVCVACGEGRRPVVEKEKDVYYGEGQFRSGAQQVKDGAAEVGWKQDEKWRTTATITGYACACPDTTAPTRPAVVLAPTPSDGTASASTSPPTTCGSPSGAATTPSCAPRCSASTHPSPPPKAKWDCSGTPHDHQRRRRRPPRPLGHRHRPHRRTSRPQHRARAMRR